VLGSHFESLPPTPVRSVVFELDLHSPISQVPMLVFQSFK